MAVGGTFAAAIRPGDNPETRAFSSLGRQLLDVQPQRLVLGTCTPDIGAKRGKEIRRKCRSIGIENTNSHILAIRPYSSAIAQPAGLADIDLVYKLNFGLRCHSEFL